MRGRRRASLLLGGIAFVSALVAQSPSAAQKKAQSPSSQAKSAAHSHDLTGVWDTQNPRGFLPNTAAFPGEAPPLTPWGQQQFEATRPAYGPRAVMDSTDPVNPTKLGAHGCYPPGVPRIYLHPVPMEIIQIPGRVFLRFEFDHLLREIWTDGRGHPSDWNPTYMGHSIGKWDGDTFVVDTIGFNDKTWLDRLGHRHSEELHVIERFRRVDHDTLQDNITMTDPKTFAKPWNTHVIFALRPDWDILEHACADNANFDENLQMQGQGK